MNKKEKILVTGGAGYIGSVLVSHLLEQDYSVTVLDSLIYQQTSLLSCCHNPRFQFVRGDVCDANLMRGLVSKADVVIPLAAIVGAPACKAKPVISRQVNLESVLSLVPMTTTSQKIIFPTSNSGYGIGEQGKFCTEETPLRPVSSYGQQKVEAEQALLETGHAVTLRFATVFGSSSRMRWDLLVNDFTHRACHDGFLVLFEEHFKRNYIHIRDVAGAFLFALENYEKMKGEPFNVGLTSANLSKRELAEKIREYVPSLYIHSAPIGEDPDKRDYIVSNAKLERLGWRAEWNLDDGIKELIKAASVAFRSQYTNL